MRRGNPPVVALRGKFVLIFENFGDHGIAHAWFVF